MLSNEINDRETAPLVSANIRQLKPYINADVIIHTAAGANKLLITLCKNFEEVVSSYVNQLITVTTYLMRN